MFQINYDNSIPEIKRSYSLFRRKYALPRMLPMTIAFLIIIVLGVDFMIRDLQNENTTSFVGYILTALSAGLLISLWVRPYTAQKKLISVIEQMGEERYIARFYDDRIEIDTEILPKDTETQTIAITKHGIQEVENPDVLEEAEAQIIKPETSVIGLTTERLYSVEDDEMFCLFVNKALIYIFPKRCMTEEQVQGIKKYFEEKAI
jgi:hypothetical protein